MRSRSRCFVDKSLAAMLSAMEIYNKPDFSYREEAFSILAINSWELLLKARILQISGNRLSSILEYEKRKRADGQLSEIEYRKKNRSGTHVSVGIFKAYDLLVNEYGDSLSPALRKNLELLVEIRDNAVHFLNKGFEIGKKVQELGCACLKNYLNATRQWFGVDLSNYNFFLMPISFFRDVGPIESISLNADEKKLLLYFQKCFEESTDEPTDNYNVALRLDICLTRAGEEDAPKVVISKEPGAIPITIDEEDIRQQYPWTYEILTTRLKKRYADFKVNKAYHKIRKRLESREKYCKIRLLDPGKPESTKKKFYNPNIIKEFDKRYTRSKPGYIV